MMIYLKRPDRSDCLPDECRHIMSCLILHSWRGYRTVLSEITAVRTLLYPSWSLFQLRECFYSMLFQIKDACRKSLINENTVHTHTELVESSRLLGLNTGLSEFEVLFRWSLLPEWLLSPWSCQRYQILWINKYLTISKFDLVGLRKNAYF